MMGALILGEKFHSFASKSGELEIISEVVKRGQDSFMLLYIFKTLYQLIEAGPTHMLLIPFLTYVSY